MVVHKIAGSRPMLLAAVMEARDLELRRLQFEEEEGNEYRLDLLEFVSACVLMELGPTRLAVPPMREPFLLMLEGLGRKYRHPRILGALAKLAREGAPL